MVITLSYRVSQICSSWFLPAQI